VRVSCFRVGAVRLCLALMLGLLAVSGYVVAPVLFARAGSHALAGMLAGQIFHIANIGIVFLAASVTVFWLRMARSGMKIGRLRWLLLLAVAVLVAINEFGITPVIVDLKAQMGPIDQVPHDDPVRKLFGMWHGVSAVLHLLATLLAVVLVGLGASSCAQDESDSGSGEACPT